MRTTAQDTAPQLVLSDNSKSGYIQVCNKQEKVSFHPNSKEGQLNGMDVIWVKQKSCDTPLAKGGQVGLNLCTSRDEVGVAVLFLQMNHWKMWPECRLTQ